ncbi:D-alanyl-D-alanine endopeptidase [Massilia aurea]|jgi:D-alanyl-D-alanine endopeptidase (penicillin-binding protein 7)|uniref:D-alanyl-D-alanine endopeptidase n=1 Tax=Massilia aurea TaxID=373040 RepID=UPI002162EB4D|nr:D-alanyl-D-alanine endopeptidase [Massilia aurea]MCS0706927.1 D-alanyl-D-alanine endopeptidase [Massilia aurea]
MFKLAVAAVVAALFAFSPVQAAGAGAGAGAGATEQAKKSSAAKKKVKRKVVRKTTATRTKKAKRQELAAAGDRPRMIRRVKTVRGKRVVTYQPVRTAAAAVAVGVAAKTVGDMAGLDNTVDPLALRSNVAFVVDQNSAEVLFEKNANVALPIASLTKLMTGMVVMDSKQDLDEVLRVTDDDVDRHKFSSSRLPVGASMTRRELLHIALMSSENRAASALGRNYPGGISAFVAAMNAKARQLGMRDTRYVDSSGLSSSNVSSGRDLAKLVMAAHGDPVLREFSTTPNSTVQASGRTMHYRNTNYLVSLPDWNIGLQKTGFINEAGRCLVMQAMIHGRNVVMVFLDSKGKMSRTADAGRIRRLIESLPDRMDVDAIRPSTITASAPGLAR